MSKMRGQRTLLTSDMVTRSDSLSISLTMLITYNFPLPPFNSFKLTSTHSPLFPPGCGTS